MTASRPQQARTPEDHGSSLPKPSTRLAAVLSTIALVVFFAIFLLPMVSLVASDKRPSFLAVTEWFDPVFFAYNWVLVFVCVAIAPTLTYFYVIWMSDEKKRRLESSFRSHQEARFNRGELTETDRARIRDDVERHFRFRNYLHSLAAVMFVIALGASVILLLKPLPCDEGAGIGAAPGEEQVRFGVDYCKGANILMLGPAIELGPRDPAYYHQIIVSLIAFQFGFLGAFIYFVSSLVRSYFTLDLTPNTFVAGTVRMVTGSVLALVLAFALPTFFGDEERFLRFLPVLSFFLGFFPSRALLVLERLGTVTLKLAQADYNSTPLSRLAGMSLDHEVRLDREGFDNLENLIHGDALDLAVRTGFSYSQLRQWIGQAWLRLHLGEDYVAFARGTGITSRDELENFVLAWRREGREGPPAPALAAVGGEEGRDIGKKIEVLCALVCSGLARAPGDAAAEAPAGG